ncbi:MAG: sulfotransferase [Alphaproteobacteria bacterium]|nr:sulfotransferase [Alphaproteobacteria bacterium]
MDTVAIETAGESRNFTELLRSARDAMQRGHFGEAERTCGSIVEAHPDQPDAWFLMGLAALRNGHADLAARHLARAVDMRRSFAPYRIALGQTLLKTGDPAGAAEHFELARLIDPLSHEAALGHAAALKMLGANGAALEAQKLGMSLLRGHVGRTFRLRLEEKLVGATTAWHGLVGRDSTRAHATACRLARRHEHRGDIARATACYERALDVRPDDVKCLHALGRLAFETENFLRARDLLEKARDLRPDDVDIRCDLGRTLSRMAFHEDALAILEDTHADKPEAVRPLLVLGWARYRAGQSQRAIADFDAVLENAPRSVEAHYGRARALVDAGQPGEAKKWLRRTLKLEPTHAGALRELANLKELTPADPAYGPLEDMLADPRVPAPRRAVLHMAAGAAHINVKAHADGFGHWRKGNALKDVVFDIEAYRKHTQAIREAFDADHFARCADWGNGSKVPVFVLGMPRSGTSLVEQILASHSNVHGAGEREDMLRLADGLGETLNDTRAYPACIESLDAEATARTAEAYLRSLKRCAPHAARIVDKMPGNFHHVGLIATLFPNAKIVHCVRDPRDTCLSIYFGDFVGSHAYSYDLTNLGRYHREYQALMRHWHDVLPGRILDLSYEEMIDDQEGRSRELVRFCGLDWEAACLDFHKTRRNVRTRSNAQVRQPIYRSSLGRWKTYQDELAPLLSALDGG